MNILSKLIKNFFFTFFLGLIIANASAQNILEESLGGVVTVGVYSTETTKKSLGFRGNSSDMAYSKMLDLSGASGSGSGFIIKYNGKPYVITNSHVVENAADEDGSIYIYTINRSKHKVKIVGGDSFYDLAVLEFTDTPGNEVSYLSFRTQGAGIGEPVYAIGNPLGEYPYTVTEGIISAKNRVRGGLTGKFGFLQTTATVIWGNSGGPLIDKDGKVLGINSQIAFASQNGTPLWQPQINFALESERAQRLISDILSNNGVVKRAFFGLEFSKKQIALEPGTREYAHALRTVKTDSLPVISGVIESSPGIVLKNYIGWNISAINNESVRNVEEVLGELEKSKPGQKVNFSLEKGGSKKEIAVNAGALDKTASGRIGRLLMQKAGASFTEVQNKLYVRFQPGKTNEAGSLSGAAKSTSGVNINSSEWEVLGAGIIEDNYNSVWRTNDIIDAGTAARLTSLSGIVDLLLFRKDGNTEDEDNYLKKRIVLSDDDRLIQQTLWY